MQNEQAFEIVRTSAKNGRLPHAYLIAGDPRGAGMDLARKICAFLLCSGPLDRAPCGDCDSCWRVSRSIHPDVFTIEPEKKSRIISMEAMIENFLPWCNKQSFSGGWKIGIILFADRLNESSANAFLKTLEEPPERTLLLLISDKPNNLLTTIRSRCQILDLSLGWTPPPEPYRSRVGEILSKHSNRSMLRVMATSQRLGDLFAEITTVAEKFVKEALKEADANAPAVDSDTQKALISAREKELRRGVYNAIQDWYRDLLMLAALPAGASMPELCYPEYLEVLREKAKGLPPRLAMRYIEFTQNIEQQIEFRNMRGNIVFPHWFTWLR